MEKLKVLAPAKINLFLEITGKRQDGYHNICSLVEKINILDEIEIFPYEKNCVEFRGQWKIPEENTVIKTLNELVSRFPHLKKANPLKIVVNKRIPPGSGLGGASSDAAIVLKTCNLIWKLNLDEKDLVRIAACIGSDVPLFLYDGPCIIEGRGDIVHPLKDLPSLKFDLFVPGSQISTKTVYENVTEDHLSDLTQARSRIKIFVSAWRDNNTEKMEKILFNRLEEVTLRLNRNIAWAKNVLEASSGRKFVLTGSGGGIYAIGKKDEGIPADLPEIIRHWRHYKTESYRECAQKEEQHGNY